MTAQPVTNLGEIGAVGGALKPLDLTLERDGGVWVQTGYSGHRIEVWDLRTKTAIPDAATVSVQDADNGVVRVIPAAALSATSGVFEARIWMSPDGGTSEEPSGLFRWSIGAGAAA